MFYFCSAQSNVQVRITLFGNDGLHNLTNIFLKVILMLSWANVLDRNCLLNYADLSELSEKFCEVNLANLGKLKCF